MRYKLLGHSGLRVSEACLGTMTFGQASAWGASREDSQAVFDAFVEAGGNFIDTAPIYQGGASETMLGEFVAPDRDRFVIGTKYSLGSIHGDPNASGNGRKSMMRAVEASLRRMKTDYIDLFWMHAWDGVTPEEEVLRGLDDLVRAGKVLHIGLSDTPAWVVARSHAIAELRGWTSLAAIQIKYSLVERSPDRDLLPMAAALGLSVLVWGGLGGGMLSGKYAASGGLLDGKGRLTQVGPAARALSEHDRAVIETVVDVARARGADPAAVALAWIRSRSPMLIPLLGARVVEQLSSNLAALTLDLTETEILRLNTPSAVAGGFPADFIGGPMITAGLFGDMRDRLDARSRLTL